MGAAARPRRRGPLSRHPALCARHVHGRGLRRRRRRRSTPCTPTSPIWTGCGASARKAWRWGSPARSPSIPRQIAVINEVFTPRRRVVAEARELVAAFEEHRRRGVYAFRFKGQMVDAPHLDACAEDHRPGGRVSPGGPWCMRARRRPSPTVHCGRKTSTIPSPGPARSSSRSHACAICRTDLHVVEGELPPLRVARWCRATRSSAAWRARAGCHALPPGDRVGIAWLRRTCGRCDLCRADRENLCERAEFTGYTPMAGTPSTPSWPRPSPTRSRPAFSDVEAAPLLCAGIIGYRALKLARCSRAAGSACTASAPRRT